MPGAINEVTLGKEAISSKSAHTQYQYDDDDDEEEEEEKDENYHEERKNYRGKSTQTHHQFHCRISKHNNLQNKVKMITS